MKRIIVGALVAMTVSVVDARAQMSMGSFQGYLTGHVGAIAGADLSEPRLAGGVSVAVQEANGWGAEFDFGHSTDAISGRQVLDVTSYLFNGSWIKPSGLIRPFATAGAGVLQINGCDAPCTRPARTYDLGVSAGGGAYVAFHDMFGVRADARYFYASAEHRDLGRPSPFSFWRVSIGANFMWAIAP